MKGDVLSASSDCVREALGGGRLRTQGRWHPRMTPFSCHCETGKASRSNLGGVMRLPSEVDSVEVTPFVPLTLRGIFKERIVRLAGTQWGRLFASLRMTKGNGPG
jgi:hypothetical protein